MSTITKSPLTKTILTALAVAAMLPVTSVMAGERGSDYVLSIVADRAHGDSIQRGQYARAIHDIQSLESRFPYPAQTNLCVSHIMLEQYDEAVPHCDKAVHLAAGAAETQRRKDRDYLGEWSMALTNRGVLRAHSGDLEGAEADFREALALNADTATPEINLAQLKVRQSESFAGK